MGKISDYEFDSVVTLEDYLVGSDNEDGKQTKSYKVGDILALVPSSDNLPRIVSGAVSGTDLTLTRDDLSEVVVDVTSLTGGGSSVFSEYSSILNMRAETVTPANGELFYLSGYTNIFDGGEGIFRWDSSSTDTDNNGTIIKATTITTGRFVREVKNNTITLEQFGGVADNGVTDSSQAFIDAIGALTILNGGTLIIPNRGTNRFHITNKEEVGALADYSNITITGGGKIFINSVNATQSVVVGRGTLVKIGDGTDNFTMTDLDILVDEACLGSGFENGVICQENLGSWSNVTLKRLKIHTESRPDTQGGIHGITMYRDTSNGSDIATCKNLTIKDCDIYLTGKNVYGIHTLRNIENILIDNNKIELTAYDDNSNDAFNAIALYGDSKNFTVTNNTILSSGHSAIAASMSENGEIAFNRIYKVSIVNEAGIEVEYKEGHGTNIGSPDFQTKGVKIHNNYVEDCYWGIAVLTREVTGSASTDVPPYDVQITNNTLINSEVNDIIIASNISGTVDYSNGRITNVLIDGNYCDSTATDANLHIYDSDGGIVVNNTFKGANKNIWVGRSSNISPIGDFQFNNNKLSGATATQAWHFESIGADTYIEIGSNVIDVDGVRGIQANALISSGVVFSIHHNIVKNAPTDGFKMNNEGADIAYSTMSDNKVFDATARGYHFDSNDGIANNNMSINCTTADTFTGTGMTASGNKDL